jgi:hypothetical protein
MEIKKKLKEGVLQLIQMDREGRGDKNLRELVAKLVHIMLALEFYKGEFET